MTYLTQELMVSDGEKREFAATSASPEWFSCFQTFFFEVNRQAGRMYGAPAVGKGSTSANPSSVGRDGAEGMLSGTEYINLALFKPFVLRASFRCIRGGGGGGVCGLGHEVQRACWR